MHVLVVATPQHPIPLADLPGVVEGALDWHERHKDKFEAFGTFPGGGGFGVVDVADGEHLNQLMLEMPFSFFSHIELYPFAPGDVGLRQMREMLAARAAG